ncbi:MULTISPECIES: bacterial Ig-like domain-containing protein [unclassified Enterococcus]|uniref:bacterial Ig-like domain-containing protein n=1 Tax=unclassified Enterococcus TaxID=2608891 RepID=UPI001CE1B277|nr:MULTISPECIES: bacterial Ig-like domain-containing protein [unclassified Enterococcus]MCA5012553.1 BspA family leucine-rich repeat surface protein [Enterococcus sp. S23]MCA5015804.1 BspA family leucine-rich repeat surface protein [Enterococcus sp. S22(2020)]
MKKRMLSIFSLVVLVASYASGIVSVYAESIEMIKEPMVYGSEEEQVQNEEVSTETSSQSAEESIDQVESSDDAYDLEGNELNSSISEERNVETQNTTELNELSDDLYTGTFGTSDWRIDSAGVLHIYEGEFATLMNIFKSPWEQYSDAINTIVFEGPVKAHRSSYHLFAKLNLVTSFVNISYLDVSDVEIMDKMFSEMSSLRELDLSNFDTSNVTSMGGMFSGMSSLLELNVSSFNTDNVTRMNGMFSEMSSLLELDVSSLNTNNVTDMRGMFSRTSSLTELDLSNFDTSNVTSMNGMFSGMSSLTKLNLSSFDNSKVTDMSYMFSGMISISELDLSNFKTTNVTNMSYMFSGMSSMSKIDLSNFETSNVTNMSYMFSGKDNFYPGAMSSLTELDVSTLDTSNVINMNHMFSGVSSLTELDVSTFDTSNVAYMSYMFSEMSSLLELDLVNWDTQNVIDMSYMFLGMNSLNKIDITNFDTSNVTNFVGMFSGVTSLTTLKLSNFDTSNVRSMNRMFSGMSSLIALDISTFDTRSITGGTTSMFSGMNSLREIVLAPNFKFISGAMSSFPKAPSEAPYTGKWMNTGDGTLNSQSRKYVFTAEELQTNYEGSSMADTYIWESDLSGINVHDSTIQVGESWNAADNFDSATDKDGNSVDFENVTVKGFVDTTKEGEYEISYSYEETTSIAKITVEAKEAVPIINVQDSSIQVGDTWKAADNFISACDKNGKLLDFREIKVTGEVDTTKEGKYEVSYSYEETTSVAKIAVKAKEEAAPIINIQDSSIQVGDNWKASDNFISACDKNGDPLDFSEIKVTGEVDTAKPGKYEVSYSYEETTSIAKITVEAKEAAPIINVHDSSIQVGDNWKASDNFDHAFDRLGNAVEFRMISVEGKVDTKKVGTYEVKYSYDGISAVAKITVKDNKKTPDKPYRNQKNTKTKDNKKQQLPKTGETTRRIDTFVGSGLILATVLFLVKKRKNKCI